jgi:hypothetical protein
MDQNRLRRLNLRLTQQEWDKIHRFAANSTCRTTSEYARKVLSQKPVRVFYRNKSFDDFEEQMVRLLPQLETVGAGFAEALKKVAPLEDTLEQRIALRLLLAYGSDLSKTIKEIKDHLIKLSDNETQNNQLQQHSQITDLQ